MSTIPVYIPKDRLQDYVVTPAPSAEQMDRYHVVQLEESLLENLGPDHVFDPEQSTFVTGVFRLANRQRAAIETALATALRAGMPYTLPDGNEDVIQTRPDEDEANLLGLAIEARDRRAAGDTDASMALRARSNTVYSLTPEQMIALTDAAKAFKQGLLAKSWQLKDAITAAEAAGDREAIQAVVWEASASAA
ncbi:DUF4376 domain-containing protein [Salinicola sp. JS01]|uniref:DUF4376 domain-containing protein n=1 Tax=Salinicola sp. JS01 TaxID=3050071 RepID=UPI00255B8899|nr:DUF4376 domain-containing protein [Salinicola sp. JS01]WIX33324.1 DUF4376 domain-containing protein [Salinicola sp. JS01]